MKYKRATDVTLKVTAGIKSFYDYFLMTCSFFLFIVKLLIA